MFIKEIILDGFKSYGSRVEIKGFDSEFNAITGLNGTGKSNILDSICFVLGINNLAQVRANSLADLVYKSGQAGVTMATVTVVFDNSIPEKSPLNFEHSKEITVTRQVSSVGKTRYLINGSTASNKMIADFFNSVQLNVNNPHFLIMQGRITKVLNMKPPEILSMIEEAAGTRMYESKKQGTQKIIEKKDTKLKEMDEMVTEQINPRLQRLKDERSQYIEYQKVQRELDQLTRIYYAWEYVKTEEACTEGENHIQKIVSDISNSKQFVEKSHQEIKDLDERISEIQRIRDSESGGKLKDTEAHLKEKEKIEAKVTAQIKTSKEAMNAEKKKRSQVDKSLKEDEKALESKKTEMSTAQSVFDALREAEKQDAEALAAAQKKFQAVSAGLLANEDGTDASLQDQLMVAKQQLAEAETEMKQCAMQLEHDKSQLKLKEPQLKKTEMEFTKDQKELGMKEKEVSNLNDSLQKITYEDGLLERLQDSLHAANAEMRRCSEIVNSFTSRYPNLNFIYKDPSPGFNRNSVKGLVCKLFTVKDEKFFRAIETAGGGKLYNVVVDTDETSSALISKGQLARRTTFAPMNKIRGAPLDPGLVRRAKTLVGANNVFPAQELIHYDPQYENIMQWVFGGMFICADSKTAMTISYKSDIQKKSITLDGDVYDPSGVLSGGASEKRSSVLAILREVVEAENAVMLKRNEISNITKKINEISQVATNFENIKQRLDLRNRELEMVRMRIEQTAHFQLQKEIEDLKENIGKKTTRIQHCNKEISEKGKRVKELQNNMKNLKAIREKELQAAENELKRIKKKAEDSRNNWKKREQEFETLNLEIQELEKCVLNGKDQIIKAEETMKSIEEEIGTLTEEHKKAQEEVKSLKSEVKALKDAIGQQNKEVEQMALQKDKLTKSIGEKELSCISLEHNLNKYKNSMKEQKEMLHDLKKKFKWIEEHREFFGQPNGMYDFEANDPQEAGSKIKRLSEMKEKLGRNISSKAMDMLDTQEEQFQEVMNKKGIIEEDRSKILSVIEELDVKKEEVIRKAWQKVDQDFNSILGSLLPGAAATLKPVKGKSFLEGLEVKVGFGGIWKESLDELSGGQRSLVALSLILAMLLFKPAPLYILDEVDAALDPSHTQNIGQMLKTHFRQSQFIIVSLKDGMFNNANVLFRTSFVDGMSSVIRTTNKR